MVLSLNTRRLALFGLSLFALAGCGDGKEVKGECEQGEERALVCGLNDRGLMHQVCPEHFPWWPSPAHSHCEDPDECVDGELGVGPGDETDLVMRPTRCELGRWEPIGPAAPISISAGGHHSCAARLDGLLLCWGRNTELQLGLQGPQGDLFDRETPVYIEGDAVEDITLVSAGRYHTCAMRSLQGDYTRVLCWGRNYHGQIGNGLAEERAYTPQHVGRLAGGVVSLAAGYAHTCAALRNGTVRCWGNADAGALGEGSSEGMATTPVDVSELGDAIAVAAGNAFSCALRETGEIACWGKNSHGQLGNGESGDELYETRPVSVLGITDAVAVSAGNLHACALLESGEVVCWGRAHDGELGSEDAGSLPVAAPVRVTGLEDAVAIAAGDSFSCAVRESGEVVCWGRGVEGQLGGAPDNAESSRTPIAVQGLSDAIAIAAGYRHACALSASGELSCWGANEAGQLGVGQKGPALPPTEVIIPPNWQPIDWSLD